MQKVSGTNRFVYGLVFNDKFLSLKNILATQFYC